MDDTARAVAERFSSLKRPTASFPVRHRVIDDLLRAELQHDPTMRVVVLGSGFDTRAFRLGCRPLARGRRARADRGEGGAPPGDTRRRTSSSVSRSASGESRSRRRSPRTRRRHLVAIVLEGVLGYLPDGERRASRGRSAGSSRGT